LQFSRVFIGSGNSDDIQAMNKAVAPAKEKRIKRKKWALRSEFSTVIQSPKTFENRCFFRSSAELKE